jgi:hypothetical protein
LRNRAIYAAEFSAASLSAGSPSSDCYHPALPTFFPLGGGVCRFIVLESGRKPTSIGLQHLLGLIELTVACIHRSATIRRHRACFALVQSRHILAALLEGTAYTLQKCRI